ncbi:MAG: elongation factor P [Deltaproteobacteria bacterium]|nr:elongation factor P [Deltaproteobacteria bacterium]
MATTSDLKKGMLIELDGDPYVVVDTTTQTPSARGAATLIKAKLRNVRTKQLLAQTFKAGERVKAPDFEVRPCQYLYDERGEVYYFMDTETFDQHPVAREVIERELNFLRPNDTVRAQFFEGECLGIEVPATVVLEVTACDPGFKGDTATHATKSATLETGLVVEVPLFVEVGDRLVVDTRESRYVRRAA